MGRKALSINFKLLALVPLTALLLVYTAEAAPVPPNVFFGKVTVGGKAAPDGLTIEARLQTEVDGKPVLTTFASSVTSSGTYGRGDVPKPVPLRVPGDDPDTMCDRLRSPREVEGTFLTVDVRIRGFSDEEFQESVGLGSHWMQ